MDTTPVTLLERLRTPGNEDAWRQLVALITPLILAWAHRVGLRRDDAADLAQDVLTVLVRKLPAFDYDPTQSFRAWLKTIAMNRWRERLRRPTAQSLDTAGQLDDLAAPDADAAWEKEYRFQLVLRAFENIKDDFQPATWQACWELVVSWPPRERSGGRTGDDARRRLRRQVPRAQAVAQGAGGNVGINNMPPACPAVLDVGF